MPDENGTETTQPDAPDVADSPFGDVPDADDASATVVDEGDSEENPTPSEDLKVVVSIKGGRAVIGVQQPSSDPHIETFEDHDLPALAQEVPAVTERAKAKWEEAPKHPAYERPAPPAKRRNNRRQQGATQDATAETKETETQQQTLRLF